MDLESGLEYEAIQPAVIGKVMPVFFERASKVVIQLVKDNLSKAKLGDLETYTDVPVLGTFHVTLTDIYLEGLDVEEAKTGLVLGPDGAFILLVEDLQANVKARFQYQRTSFPQISGDGSAYVESVGGHAKLGIRVANDGAGRPLVTAVDAAELWFQGVHVTTSDTDLAWLYNIITNLAQQPIQDAITREVASQVTQKVPMLANNILQGIPTTLDVKGLELNISLAGDPLVTQDALVIRDWGQFQSPGSGWEECPYRRAKSGAAVLQSEGQGFNKTKNPLIIGILDQSLATCFTWVLFERGQLGQYFEGDDIPGYALYTATWGLIVPELIERYPGNRKMSVQVNVASPPTTSINPSRGVVTSGNITLAFHLLPDEAGSHSAVREDSTGVGSAVGASRKLLQQEQVGKKGAHLFTMGISGEIRASKLQLEPDAPDRPDSYRLGVTMELVMDSLKIQVLSSDVGEVIEARLELLVSLVAYLLQAEINQSVLKDGFPLPDIPHVHFVDLDLAFVDYAVKLAANVQYVP
ncbi:g9699 [Coccomyxa viridis]|uniref:G9699 protein n=1 Tax=Coccomyxa viridis TaxID=1274662 RepID=A0ABP1G3N8_9CHLO